MGEIFPALQNIFSSSSPHAVAFATYVWPVIPFVFGVTVVVAITIMILNFFAWLGWKIVDLTPSGRMKHLREEARMDVSDNAQNLADWHLWRKSKGYE